MYKDECALVVRNLKLNSELTDEAIEGFVKQEQALQKAVEQYGVKNKHKVLYEIKAIHAKGGWRILNALGSDTFGSVMVVALQSFGYLGSEEYQIVLGHELYESSAYELKHMYVYDYECKDLAFEQNLMFELQFHEINEKIAFVIEKVGYLDEASTLKRPQLISGFGVQEEGEDFDVEKAKAYIKEHFHQINFEHDLYEVE